MTYCKTHSLCDATPCSISSRCLQTKCRYSYLCWGHSIRRPLADQSRCHACCDREGCLHWQHVSRPQVCVVSTAQA